MGISTKITFALRGALSDLQGRRVLNWNCSSPRLLEEKINGSFRLKSVPAYRPAIYEDGSFLLEPIGTNFFTWSQDLTHPSWVKGSNVQVRKPPERPLLPDASGVAQEVNWFNGVGNTQKLQRTFGVKGAADYIIKFILQPRGGRCSANDVIRVIGGVASSAKIQLSELNDYQGRYRILELKFRTAGTQPTLPVVGLEGFSITEVTNSTFTISSLEVVAINSMKGGQVKFNNAPTVLYMIAGNTATTNGSITVTVEAVNLPGSGVTIVQKASLLGQPDQVCTLEISSESVFSMLWGDVTLEEGLFSTSFIPQEGEQSVRAAALLEAQPKDNPLRDLRSFGVYGRLKSWKGNGNLINFGDFKIDIVDGKLTVTAGTTQVQDTSPLPALDASFFVMVAAETSSISLFVDGKLKNRSSLVNFRPTSNPVIFSSKGVRLWHTIVCFGEALLDGKPEIGQMATQEVNLLFSEIVVPASLISSQFTVFELTPVKVSGLSKPAVSGAITAAPVVATRKVLLASTAGFAVGDTVAIVRGEKPDIVNHAMVEAVAVGDLTLGTVAGIRSGDSVFKGEFGIPGRAFVRFPFVAIDEQRVQEINYPTRKVRLSSSLAYIPNLRAIVRNEKNQDVTEVMVTAIDPGTNEITVSDATKIQVGHYIAQTLSETRIDWQLYVPSFKVGIPGVRIGKPRSQNGVLIENTTPSEVSVTVRIEAFL